MIVNTDAADGDLIEQFKNDVAAFDYVDSVYRKGGVEVCVKVEKRDTDGFGRVPDPRKDMDDLTLTDGKYVGSDYVVGNLTGSGSSPGGYYVHHFHVNPVCDHCGEGAGEEEVDGDVVCWSCYKDTDAFGRGD